MKNIFLILLISIFIYGCSEQNPDEFKSNSIDKNGIKAEANLSVADSSGKLNLKLIIRNNSNKYINIDYASIQISNEEGIRSNPIDFNKDAQSEVKPNSKAEYNLIYLPVNNFQLFREANLTGDLRRKYFLKSDFIYFDNSNPLKDEKINFELNEEFYNSFIKKNGIENKIKIYKYNFDNNEFSQNEIQYLNKIIPVENIEKIKKENKHVHEYNLIANHSVNIADNEILTDGIAIKFSAYKLKDSSYVDFRLVNHGIYTLKIIPQNFKIFFEGKELIPMDNFSNIKNKKDEKGNFIVLRSERFIHKFVYNSDEEFSEFKVDNSGIKINGSDINFFFDKIDFKLK